MHIPVLPKEVLEYLNPKSNENFIDCTIGEGGHAIAILERSGPNGKLLGIDLDSQQIENCKLEIENYKNRIILVVGSYTNLKEIIRDNNFGSARPVRGQGGSEGEQDEQGGQTSNGVNGILLDLGMSSWHLDDSGRGFAFMKNEPLDMRYLKDNELTARQIVNSWRENDIEAILREYGEERLSRRIAKAIVEARRVKKLETTTDLIEVIKKAVPRGYERGRIHFATRTFQALRIAVNQELENLKNVLPQAIEVLEPGGRLVVISFHSLEDRIVKNFFRDQSKDGVIKILTKKPITASLEEIKSNNRSRSAKLRAIVKT
ncbi:16S rRNA (cytosine(1402)-N(4))-methyltransferase RsmH [Patescibacteria group bacterium]|nr:16S rRNA (cytosine(1402)-N(4))-methyltransferase RsmH [Patescibacteria group bacterium]